MRYILWSGGWDSTYLLVKRARESDETIQPIYVAFRRGSEVNERKRRLKIWEMLKSKDLKATINPPIEVDKDALPPSEEFETAYENLKETLEAMYGDSMYAFLGRVTLLFPNPEIAIEAPAPGIRDMGRIEKLMRDKGLEIDDDGRVTPGIGDPDTLIVLGCFRYPLLHTTELQMLDDVKAWGFYDDVFQDTWSCYSGLERQCGVCRACEVKWESGDAFQWRFDERAIKDHAIKEFLKTKGDRYAEFFVKYIMNGDWVNVDDDDNKSERLMKYFTWLENNYPDMESINAPAI